MTTSPNGEALIKRFERLALVPYKDTGGVWTWGWGHAKGPHEIIPIQITEAEAELIFRFDLSYAEEDMQSLQLGDIPQNIYDGLCSLLFNVGYSQLRQLPCRTLTAIRAKDWPTACERILTWCHDNGKFIQGLYNRRKMETDLILHGVYPNG